VGRSRPSLASRLSLASRFPRFLSRLARVIVPGVADHVTQRGNHRQQVFYSDEDRRLYRPLNGPEEVIKMRTLFVLVLVAGSLSVPLAFSQATGTAGLVKTAASTAVPKTSDCTKCAAANASSHEVAELLRNPFPAPTKPWSLDVSKI
jgi:hypothetical protein